MDFNDFYCFRLGAISRKMTRYYNNKLAPYGITIVQSWVLLFLSAQDGSSLKDIAGAIQLTAPWQPDWWTAWKRRLVLEGRS